MILQAIVEIFCPYARQNVLDQMVHGVPVRLMRIAADKCQALPLLERRNRRLIGTAERDHCNMG